MHIIFLYIDGWDMLNNSYTFHLPKSIPEPGALLGFAAATGCLPICSGSLVGVIMIHFTYFSACKTPTGRRRSYKSMLRVPINSESHEPGSDTEALKASIAKSRLISSRLSVNL